MHLPRTQTVMIDGLPPQSFQRPYSWESETYGGWQVGYSFALVCPVCLRVWARLHMEGSDTFGVVGQPCQRHPTGKWDVAGSILPRNNPVDITLDMGLFDHLPLNLLQREFALTLAHAERFNLL